MEEQINRYWEETLDLLKESFSGVVFDTLLKPLIPISLDDNVLFLKTPSYLYKGMMKPKYINDINQNLRAVTKITDMEVKIITSDDVEEEKKSVQGKVTEQYIYSRLKDKYVFETFVKGKSNELAYAAALAVSESPGVTYNPLFLYGGVGLGKTHLMHSIGNYILEQNPASKVIYTSSEAFMNELINSIKETKNQEFRNKYRDIDVLLIDDIQFLSDKERTQEEFFHTFNTLYDSNKQIVISSDQPPNKLKILEDRLRSRFSWGLIVDITLPDFETRTAILEKKSEIDNIIIPKDVTLYIAKNIVSNIRDLEGALNKVAAYAKLANAKINLSLAEKAIKDIINENEKKAITVEYIQEIVANYYNITPQEIRSKKRTQNITYPRQIAMYLSRKIVDLPLTKIGEGFGGRDHTTIIHGCDKISSEIETDMNLRDTVLNLEKRIRD